MTVLGARRHLLLEVAAAGEAVVVAPAAGGVGPPRPQEVRSRIKFRSQPTA